MAKYVLSRIGQMIITVFVVSLVAFFLVRLRGDPVTIMAPPTFSAEQVENLRRAWGFDKPLGEQYVIFLRKAVTGNFGDSFQHRRPAMELVLERVRWTYLLAGLASIISLAVAIPLGVGSALKRNSILDLCATALSTVGTAMPAFWLGLMLILLFSVRLRILPVYGVESLRGLILPAVTLGVGMAARLSRLTRSSMLEVLRQDYVRTAHAKGLGFRTVISRHALRNALIPVVTAFGLQLGWALGGAVVVETVFTLPGLGRLMIDSLRIRDITVVQAGLLWFAVSFSLVNLGIDMLYTVLDPRVRYD